ncbi:hypothetical protein I7V28_19210 [Lelliottia amnigena]|uniref:hypothetical protein n=1 Tax=Lelliottia TaxID=1330545 RepID=UPI00192BCC68|nr:MULTISPECIES: hypothetical protein [Lelliottia]MBL5885634.1 hypothetical protein [Lelliottia aquatilis]MBL5923212.1 hypothetical protein [Lelliottia amnigena]MBL5932122.1 hypothetical protein [Lelliottia amnigena]
MNKLIVSTVSSVNEFASGYPELVSLVIDDALASRIRKVAVLVKEHNLLLAELNEFGAVWSDCDEDTALGTLQAERLSVLDSEQQVALSALIEAQGKRVDAHSSGFLNRALCLPPFPATAGMIWHCTPRLFRWKPWTTQYIYLTKSIIRNFKSGYYTGGVRPYYLRVLINIDF